MGTFQVAIKIASLGPVPKFEKEVFVWVDSGATLTQIPKTLLDQLGIPRLRRIRPQLADGSFIERDVGTAFLLVEGIPIGVDVIFGEQNDPALLGSTALEAAGLMIDPIAQKLIPRQYIIQY